jgi:hypothetical protein
MFSAVGTIRLVVIGGGDLNDSRKGRQRLEPRRWIPVQMFSSSFSPESSGMTAP